SFSVLGGQEDGGPFFSTVTVTELPLDGWKLSDIECENVGATGFEITENGFTATCDGGGFVTCTFFNVPASNIPALSEWGMIAAAGGLGLIGLFYAVRRKKAAA
ncbi:MAG TPA: IPTL-CTERM sorting domain-containing protein, partial [Thermodesulfobacteriota bacterium]|nr:IPTL-CTERM sorting domain-containing protein [Thermodesulfobacteriota bacterium]